MGQIPNDCGLESGRDKKFSLHLSFLSQPLSYSCSVINLSNRLPKSWSVERISSGMHSLASHAWNNSQQYWLEDFCSHLRKALETKIDRFSCVISTCKSKKQLVLFNVFCCSTLFKILKVFELTTTSNQNLSFPLIKPPFSETILWCIILQTVVIYGKLHLII